MKPGIFLAYLLLANLCSFSQQRSATEARQDLNGKVLVAVFAHPDDEETVAQVLAKYAREGAKVYLIVVTDGRFGVTDFAKIPAGDSLAKIRSAEINCAAEKMGIEPPILLGFHDKLDIDAGFDAETKQLNLVRDKLIKLFEALKPDVVITWPSGGWTAHLDHRLVGDIVTEVFAGTHWGKPVRLYFGGLPYSRKLFYSPFKYAIVDSAYLTVSIKLSPEDMEKAKAAWACHKSQYTPDGIKYMSKLFWDPKAPQAWFRPFFSNGAKSGTLFP